MASEWPIVRLGDYTESSLGKMLDAKKNKGEYQPYLGNSNVRWGQFDLSELAQMRFEDHEEARYGLRNGDLVVCEGGEPGRCAIWRGPTGMKIQKALHRVRGRDGLSSQFLYYWLTFAGRTGLLEPHFTGTTIKHLTGRALASLRVPFPPPDAQQAMVDVLSPLDDRIDNLRQTNATLEAIAQALFKSWFVDFDPVRAKAEGREPEGMDAATATLFPSEFEDSELGPIPRGWQVRRVAEVASIIRGRSYKSSELDVSPTALVTLKSFNRGGGFRRDGFKSYTGIYKPEQVVEHGDCVVAFTDVTQQAEVIGRSALVTGSPDHERLVASLDVGIVRTRNDAFCPQFFAALFSGDRYVGHIRGFTTGTTVLHLAKDGIPGFQFVCPPDVLAAHWGELARSLFERQATNIQMQESLAALRDTLLPRLISGKLRLPDAKREAEATLA